jgi:hypothetical protein
MTLPIDPVSAAGAGLPAPSSGAMSPSMDQSLRALHQAAQAPEAVGHGVRSESASRSSAPLELLNRLTDSVISPGRTGLPPTTSLTEVGTLNDGTIEGLQRVSTFAIQTSVQLASESTMLSVTSALASAANTTFHQLLTSNE